MKKWPLSSLSHLKQAAQIFRMHKLIDRGFRLLKIDFGLPD